jgi:hypothetical protein
MEWNGIASGSGAEIIPPIGCIIYEMEWNGMEWNGMEWNGMEWNGMEWNGMEWNGIASGSVANGIASGSGIIMRFR